MSRLPSTGPSLQRWLRQQERKAQRQQQSSAFNRSGTSVTAEGVQSLDGTLTVAPDTGFVSIDGSLGVHGTAAFDGSTTIGGDLTVAGTLSLPNAIIGNDALTNMVAPASVQDSLMGFAIPTPSAVVRAKSLTVPAGITSALVTVTVRVFGVNSTAGLDSLVTNFQIGGAPRTWTETVTVGAGGMGKTIATHTDSLTLLTPESTFNVAVYAGCTAGWAANALNGAWIDGYVLWFR